ncbi:MAG: hypothetical protein K2M97_02770, partial [Muribaculaceae bacterium]|nr:hypothetical protein [Muribaculaceae bacterium]
MTIKKLTILAAALAAAATASAVPAMRGLRPVTLPDGTTMMVERVGDEHRSFTLNADGALLRWTGDTYRLADLAADGTLTDSPVAVRWDSPAVQQRIAALESSAESPRSPMRVASGVGTLPDRNFPRLGHQKALVLLVQYKDVKFTLDDPYTYFHDMLNKEGFCDPVYGGTGSCRDFFIESSGGRFVPQFDVFGPVTLPNDRAYYGTNAANGGIDPKAPYMAVHACQQLDKCLLYTSTSPPDISGSGE